MVRIHVNPTNENVNVNVNNVDSNIDINTNPVNANVNTGVVGDKYYTDLAKEWAIKMDGKVLGQDFSSKYYAAQAKESEEIATAAVETIGTAVEEAQGYAESAQESAEYVVNNAPTATIEQTSIGAIITTTDLTHGTTTATILNGEKGDKGDKGDTGAQGSKGDKGDKGDTGDDGYSPTATVTKTGSTATITITDKNGTTTANVYDGTGGGGIWGSITGTLSDQTDLQNALDLKASISSLATVATSGSYNDLTNKPTIPIVDQVYSASSSNAQSGTAIAGAGFLTSVPIATTSSLGLVQPDGTTITINNGVISGASSVDIDNLTITENSNNELQTVGVIDQNNTTTAIKTWTGTKAQYDAIVTKDANTLYNITDDTDVTLTLLEALYPVGSIYIGTMATCPLATLGVGTWQLVASDRVLQGAGTRGAVGDTVNESLPNITGSFGLSNYNGTSYGLFSGGGRYSGAFYQGDTTQQAAAPQNTAGRDAAFDASLSSSTYQNNAPVQQDAYLVNIWERIS